MEKLVAINIRPAIASAAARRGRRRRSTQNGTLAAIMIGATADVTANQRNGCWVMDRKGIAAHTGLLICVLIISENVTSTASAGKDRLPGAENFFPKITTAGSSIMIVAIASRPIHQMVSFFSGENVEKTKFLR